MWPLSHVAVSEHILCCFGREYNRFLACLSILLLPLFFPFNVWWMVGTFMSFTGPVVTLVHTLIPHYPLLFNFSTAYISNVSKWLVCAIFRSAQVLPDLLSTLLMNKVWGTLVDKGAVWQRKIHWTCEAPSGPLMTLWGSLYCQWKPCHFWISIFVEHYFPLAHCASCSKVQQ